MFAVVIMTLVTFWVHTISVKSRKRVKWTVKNVGVIIAQLYFAKNGAVLNNNTTHGCSFFMTMTTKVDLEAHGVPRNRCQHKYLS